MPHPLIAKRYHTMITRNEGETILGNCCLCHTDLIRVDYEWYERSHHYRYGQSSSTWQASHETNVAYAGATHCCECEKELRDSRNRIVNRQRVNFVERDGTIETELITRAPLHPGWRSYFKAIGMSPIK